MFAGRFEHSLDEKNRITLPARFRNELKNGVVITQGLEACLLVFTREKFQQIAEMADAHSLTQEENRLFTLMIFPNAIEDVPDAQGRVRIPDYLLEYAGVKSEAVIVGMNSRLEIWSPEGWAAKQEYLRQHREKIVPRLAVLGI